MRSEEAASCRGDDANVGAAMLDTDLCPDAGAAAQSTHIRMPQSADRRCHRRARPPPSPFYALHHRPATICPDAGAAAQSTYLRLPQSADRRRHRTGIGEKNKEMNTSPRETKANRVVEVDGMWRAREKELELETKLKSRTNGHTDSRCEKRKINSKSLRLVPKIEQDSRPCATSSSARYSLASVTQTEDGLGDDEEQHWYYRICKTKQ
ncbi:uncharacterized protein LOC133883720 isoform X2 [Phragmites australis]|uniref:uncharacterized protein LOC133883720 isoform X2 n=1 Tax=Phragmites australis TaxID=29695 RepID=UPI002D789E6B|nr:uncharacterized protein LOC133883720 isoform X2 [Phragmites australis]